MHLVMVLKCVQHLKLVKGVVFISADYSQIELRVLAYLSQDENLMNAFYKDMIFMRKLQHVCLMLRLMQYP